MSDNGSSEEKIRPPAAETRGGFASGRMSSAAVPLEKSMNFGPSTKRLLRRMGPERSRLSLVVVLAIVSVSLVVLGPRVLGHATDLIVSGISGGGIDFTAGCFGAMAPVLPSSSAQLPMSSKPSLSGSLAAGFSGAAVSF